MVVCEHNYVIEINSYFIRKTRKMSAAKKVGPLFLMCFPLFVHAVEVAVPSCGDVARDESGKSSWFCELIVCRTDHGGR